MNRYVLKNSIEQYNEILLNYRKKNVYLSITKFM